MVAYLGSLRKTVTYIFFRSGYIASHSWIAYKIDTQYTCGQEISSKSKLLFSCSVVSDSL